MSSHAKSPTAYSMPQSTSKSSRSGLSTSLTLAGMSLGYGVVQLDVTIINTALVSIGSPLGGGLAELQWVVSAAGAAIWRGASKRRE